ncbi:MAG: rhomboid family intramembrane serine protease [Treponema sp.]|nr:rhomboid family intramembrane serine protease [Treponema sp.]
MSKQLFFQKPFKYTFFNATLILAGINALVLVATFAIPNLPTLMALNPYNMIKMHWYWQPFTYMFVHGSISHLFWNMLVLVSFGIHLERALGSKEFILMYLVCGVISGLLSFGVYVLTGQYGVFLMGASGAIYAILFAYAVAFPRAVVYIWGLIPVPAPILVLIYTIIEVLSEVTGMGGSVAHLTHLFGFLAAFLYILIRMKINPFKVWKNS